MGNSMLLSEWVRFHTGITLPNFVVFGGGVADAIVHLVLYLFVALIITSRLFWFYHRFIETKHLGGG